MMMGMMITLIMMMGTMGRRDICGCIAVRRLLLLWGRRVSPLHQRHIAPPHSALCIDYPIVHLVHSCDVNINSVQSTNDILLHTLHCAYCIDYVMELCNANISSMHFTNEQRHIAPHSALCHCALSTKLRCEYKQCALHQRHIAPQCTLCIVYLLSTCGVNICSIRVDSGHCLVYCVHLYTVCNTLWVLQ